MTLHQIGVALRKRGVAVLATGLLAALLAGGVALLVGPSYSATARILLTRPQAALPGSDGLLTTENLNLQALTFAQVVVSQDFIDNALRQAGVNSSGVQVSTAVEQNTSVLVIKTQGPSADRANAAARALNTALSDEVDLTGKSPAGPAMTSRVIQSPAATRSSTGSVFATFVGLVLGLAVAVTLALLTEGS